MSDFDDAVNRDLAAAPPPRSERELSAMSRRRRRRRAIASTLTAIGSLAVVVLIAVAAAASWRDGSRDPQVRTDAPTTTVVQSEKRPVLRTPSSAEYSDSRKAVLVADIGLHQILMVDPAGHTSPVAGNGKVGFSGDGGDAREATLSAPRGLSQDGRGNIYFADPLANVVRRVATNGEIATVAGTGVAGFSGDGGIATSASLNQPWDTAVGTDGSIYVADKGNNRVRRIDTAGKISTVAGNGNTGDFVGGSALSSAIGGPNCLAFDTTGNMYICESDVKTIRVITPTGDIRPSSVTMNAADLAAGPDGTIYAANYGDYSIDRLQDDRAVSLKQFRLPRLVRPESIAVDRDDNILVVDGGQSQGAVSGTIIRLNHDGTEQDITPTL
jgi:sugar lactone lactonase YvrE